VTNSWSELQNLTNGPNAGFSEKSPYTGQLSVNVVPKSDGSCSCGSKKK
jgi:hypothetical protein